MYFGEEKNQKHFLNNCIIHPKNSMEIREIVYRDHREIHYTVEVVGHG